MGILIVKHPRYLLFTPLAKNVFHLLLVFTEAAHFPHTHHLAGHKSTLLHYSVVATFFRFFNFSKLLLFLYLLFVSILPVPPIFPPPLSGAGHSYRARLISPVSQHSGRIPQPGSHQAKLCHNTVRPLCPALLCCCSDVHSWSAAPAVLLLTLMLLTNNWRLLCIVSQHSLVPRWSSERHKGLVG